MTLAGLSLALYAVALAIQIDHVPFHFNPHRLRHTAYRCVWCWNKAGTRSPRCPKCRR